MNKETLKRDLCSRLPYGVIIKNTIKKGFTYPLKTANIDFICSMPQKNKPVLFPLSCVTKVIEVSTYNNGKPFVPIEELKSDYRLDLIIGVYSDGTKCLFNDKTGSSSWKYWEYAIIEKLNQWHINYRLSPDQFIEATNEYE